jgi:hypothetical protein
MNDHIFHRKSVAAWAVAASAMAGLVLTCAPASAADDPLKLGDLQITPTSGQMDRGARTGWLQRAFTNQGEVCPDGHRAEAAMYALVEGDSTAKSAAYPFLAGNSYSPNTGGINPGETSINRSSGPWIVMDVDSSQFPWSGIPSSGALLELRHTCQAGVTYSPATDPYYSVWIKVEADNSWEQTTPPAPVMYDSSESDVTVDIPQEAVPTGPTGLKIAVKPGPAVLTGPSGRVHGAAWQATGALDAVTVLDDRRVQDADPWTLSGRASDFTAGSETEPLSASHLGWTPAKVSGAGQAGQPVTPGDGAGLGADRPLATGAASAEADVVTVVNAELALAVPSGVPAGHYAATLTLTLI